MAISEAVRKEVMERDHGECMFFHRQPVPATEISHFDHQGLGGLPPDHWKNQAPNLAASCGECHRRFPAYKWGEFTPLRIEDRSTDDVDYPKMVIYDLSGKIISKEDLWFYVRHEATRLQLVEARIQGLAMIEGDVARDLYELSKGYKLLEPDAVSFSQYIAGRNVSATKATQAARAYGWMEESGLTWPVGLTSEKADILRKAIENNDFLFFIEEEEAQAYLDAAVDQSVSDLKQELIDAGLMKASVRWYVHIRYRISGEKYPLFSGLSTFIRARSVVKALEFNPTQGDMVLRADKFVAGLNWDRKTKVLSDRDGNVIPYKDLT